MFEKFVFRRGACFFDRRPDSTAGLGYLLVAFATRAPLEIVQSISRENQMGVRINKSRKHKPPAKIDNLRVARCFFDLVVWADDVDLSVANEHPTVANDLEFGQFFADSRTFRARQRNELRRVKES